MPKLGGCGGRKQCMFFHRFFSPSIHLSPSCFQLGDSHGNMALNFRCRFLVGESGLVRSFCRLLPSFREKKLHLLKEKGVSKNNGKTSKSSILIGFSIINHPFWGTPIFGNIQTKQAKPKHVFLHPAGLQ